MKKRVFYGAMISIVMLFLITGCFSKKSISSEQFKSIAEENGLFVVNVGEQFADFDYVREAYVATSTEGWQIEFYVLSDDNNAQKMYQKNKIRFEQNKANYKESTVNLSNHTKYTLQTSTAYRVLSRIDNTLIYVDASKNYKSNIQKVIKSLGY